jgi:hypothetical protein
MERRYSEPPHELHDITPPNITMDSDPSGDGSREPSTSAANGPVNAQHDRPKVRFNSREDVPAEARRAQGDQPRKLRPALSRNPNSYGSNAGDIADEPLSEEKIASAAAAARRGHAAAMDAHAHSRDDSANSSRWSMESELPMTQSYAPLRVRHEEASLNTKLAAEAEGLIKAHTRSLQSPLHRHTGRSLNF